MGSNNDSRDVREDLWQGTSELPMITHSEVTMAPIDVVSESLRVLVEGLSTVEGPAVVLSRHLVTL